MHLNGQTISDFENMVNIGLKKAEERWKEKKVEYDDAPDEFLDPITTELMEDPVILPQSKITLDRITIETQLLSCPEDPYTRSPLKKEDLIPNVELKNKIDQYKKNKKCAK